MIELEIESAIIISDIIKQKDKKQQELEQHEMKKKKKKDNRIYCNSCLLRLICI